jgi:hypothetical protein
MITIKAWTNSNKLIVWNYETPQQAAPVWNQITATGRMPDNSEGLSRADLLGAHSQAGRWSRQGMVSVSNNPPRARR